jgi:hypothetical protein
MLSYEVIILKTGKFLTILVQFLHVFTNNIHETAAYKINNLMQIQCLLWFNTGEVLKFQQISVNVSHSILGKKLENNFNSYAEEFG